VPFLIPEKPNLDPWEVFNFSFVGEKNSLKLLNLRFLEVGMCLVEHLISPSDSWHYLKISQHASKTCPKIERKKRNFLSPCPLHEKLS